MIAGTRVLGVITARGGSKGVVGKNTRQVAGRPLIAWTIAAARASRWIDRTIVSTDDEAIARVAREAGGDVPFLRPTELATDTASSIEVVLHALDAVPGYGAVVLLQPTSPLRSTEDIDGAIKLWARSGAPSCASVAQVEQHPRWMFNLGPSGQLDPVLGALGSATRRQDLPDVYALNGAVYVADTQWLREQRAFVTTQTVGFPMPQGRSLDIDTELDFLVLDCMLREASNA